MEDLGYVRGTFNELKNFLARDGVFVRLLMRRVSPVPWWVGLLRLRRMELTTNDFYVSIKP